MTHTATPCFGPSKRAIRPAYAPMWFVVGLGLERLHDRLVPR